jgi:hypothetical protein
MKFPGKVLELDLKDDSYHNTPAGVFSPDDLIGDEELASMADFEIPRKYQFKSQWIAPNSESSECEHLKIEKVRLSSSRFYRNFENDHRVVLSGKCYTVNEQYELNFVLSLSGFDEDNLIQFTPDTGFDRDAWTLFRHPSSTVSSAQTITDTKYFMIKINQDNFNQKAEFRLATFVKLFSNTDSAKFIQIAQRENLIFGSGFFTGLGLSDLTMDLEGLSFENDNLR